jgi:hypothetical protein
MEYILGIVIFIFGLFHLINLIKTCIENHKMSMEDLKNLKPTDPLTWFE